MSLLIKICEVRMSKYLEHCCRSTITQLVFFMNQKKFVYVLLWLQIIKTNLYNNIRYLTLHVDVPWSVYDVLISSLLNLCNRSHGGKKSGSYLYFKLSDIVMKTKKLIFTEFVYCYLLLKYMMKNIVFK